MSRYTATYFLDGKTNFRGSDAANPSFYIEPEGWHQGGYVTLLFSTGTSLDDQLQIAERLAQAAIEWRDSLAARADAARTAASELEAARAEIARLKAEAGEES